MALEAAHASTKGLANCGWGLRAGPQIPELEEPVISSAVQQIRREAVPRRNPRLKLVRLP
eukprot:CAMPEP_0206267476 /NCGR_PEP_ID=MMETSP0047_2-20121206/31171_1 /ASSEMBLY_ACC=CAM_ASM_000192 /TAXON_ID=195065 /ORGANISM="Chroomonas mesostigmatica_cf, Strain CCMP1168" /LENGTH=59 /DNA_ID=CAMNT_0053695685 /DNA_START=161 /DNA_END=336 /DNA_ORIENTATION=+